MAMKFVESIGGLALLVITFVVDKPQEEKILLS